MSLVVRELFGVERVGDGPKDEDVKLDPPLPLLLLTLVLLLWNTQQRSLVRIWVWSLTSIAELTFNSASVRVLSSLTAGASLSLSPCNSLSVAPVVPGPVGGLPFGTPSPAGPLPGTLPFCPVCLGGPRYPGASTTSSSSSSDELGSSIVKPKPTEKGDRLH